MKSSPLATLLLLATLHAPLQGQPIIAQSNGLPNPDHVIDFGANLFPNFTPVTTQFQGITITHARYFTTGVSNNLVGGFLTNDFSGPPDRLIIQFATPIRDLSFVYHQIGTTRPSVFNAVYRGQVVDTFTNLSNQAQTNNYFGFTNVVFDELQIDFVSDFNVDTLAFNDVMASCTTRNGSGINPVDYACVTLPVLGTNWQSTIVTTPLTLGTFLAIVPGGPSVPLPLLAGEVLIPLTVPPVFLSGPGTFSVPMPTGSFWLGAQVATQGIRVDAVGPAQRIVLLNALDLRLGL